MSLAEDEDLEPCFICPGQVVFSEEYGALGTVKALHAGFAWVDFPLLGGGYWTAEAYLRPAVLRKGRWT